MGLPSRLHGNSLPFPSDVNVCPKCGRRVRSFMLKSTGDKEKVICPYCKYEFKLKNTKFRKSE